MSKIPQIKIGADYFRTTVRKESIYSLPWRWIKETLQNAYDAGADKVIVNIDKTEKTVEIIDNGCGMDEDTLLDTFLSFGGSKKEDGSIGGFGDAKKIVCFCWDKWEIHTLDNYLNNDLMGDHLEKGNLINGTRIKVWMEELFMFSWNNIIQYLELCQVPVKIVVNKFEDGKLVEAVTPKPLRKSKKLKDVGVIGELYCNKSRTDKAELLVVRLNGLALFKEYLSGINACMILELNPEACGDPKNPDYPLNVTRESLVYQYDTVLNALIHELMSSPSKALKSEREKKIVIHRGKGAIHGVSRKTNIASNTNTNTIDSGNNNGDLGRTDGQGITAGAVLSMIGGENVKVEYDNEDSTSLHDVFPFDIIIKGKTSKRYDAIKYKKILLAWHKMLMYVCYYNILNGFDIDLGDYYIGFVFEENVCAQRVKMSSGEVFYLINPSGLNFQDYGWRGLTLEILSRAIHEIAHNFVSEHNGKFQEIQTSMRIWCHMYMDDIFNDIGLILKSKEKDLVMNASLDEVLVFDDDE